MVRRLAMGLDIGGSHVSAVLSSADGTVLRSCALPLDPARGLSGTLRRSAEVVARVLPKDKRGLFETLGVAFPGFLEGPQGRVLFAPNLPGWVGRSAPRELARSLGRPVLVENDANCAAWAEHRLGGHRGAGAPDLLYVVLGTGIGGGVVLDGRLLRGALGSAGEIGHTRVPGTSRRCGCGNVGCLEALAGGRALSAQAEALARSRPSSTLGRLRREKGHLTAWDLLREAERGNALCRGPRDVAAEAIGDALGSAVNLLGTLDVVLGGRLLERAPGFFARIRSAFDSSLLPPLRGKVELRRARAWEHRNELGATQLALAGPRPFDHGHRP